MTLKIRTRSPKFNQFFPSSQQCIYASLVKIHILVQKITNRNHILHISKCTCDLENENKVKVTKFNELFPSSQQCVYASLVKIHQLVQKIMHGNKKADADPNGICIKNNIHVYPPHPPGWGDIILRSKMLFIWTYDEFINDKHYNVFKF